MDALVQPVRGLVAGKYEVLELIGRGGMGSVWKGRHSTLGTHVAIKFVDAEHAQSEEARHRFVTEARAAATIQSKHAIQIYDHGLTDDGKPYIVMELLVGEPLDKRIEHARRLTLPETARILGQVCRALGRAHDAGVIHRDLKPENIFLVRSPDDDEEIAKVLDFGIAKIRPPAGALAATSSTKTGAVLGTPYYMSPEQARGLRNIDHRTDLWSLGVIAYKCVTGSLPFDGESVGDLLVKICTAPLPVPSQVVPALPPTFDGWFFRALERDPGRRFERAADLADALALAAGVSARRGPPSANSEDAGSGSSAHGASARGPSPLLGPSPRAAYEPAPGDRAKSGPNVTLPAASNTSAPFTASPSPVRAARRGVRTGAIIAALLGVSIGAAAILKYVDRSKTVSGNGASAASSAVPPPNHEPTTTPAATTLSPMTTPIEMPAAPAPQTAPLEPIRGNSPAERPAAIAPSERSTPNSPAASASVAKAPTAATPATKPPAKPPADAVATTTASHAAAKAPPATRAAGAASSPQKTPAAKPAASGAADPGY